MGPAIRGTSLIRECTLAVFWSMINHLTKPRSTVFSLNLMMKTIQRRKDDTTLIRRKCACITAKVSCLRILTVISNIAKAQEQLECRDLYMRYHMFSLLPTKHFKGGIGSKSFSDYRAHQEKIGASTGNHLTAS